MASLQIVSLYKNNFNLPTEVGLSVMFRKNKDGSLKNVWVYQGLSTSNRVFKLDPNELENTGLAYSFKGLYLVFPGSTISGEYLLSEDSNNSNDLLRLNNEIKVAFDLALSTDQEFGIIRSCVKYH